ncbi:MAG: hypothetical protein V4666_06795 [Bacteroidota bacterium]
MIDFLLKSTISLIIFIGFYHLVLEREKIHKFNRFYLLIAILISLVIPFVTFEFIKIIPVVQNIEPVTIDSIWKSSENLVFDNNETQVEETTNYIPYVISSFYMLVTLILSVRFGKNYFKLISKISSNPIVKYKKAKLVLIEEKILPHTFKDSIFVNFEDYNNRNIEEELYAHEMVHVTQKHTLDILFIEFLMIVFWFNPIFIYYKRAIQLNHEFLADEEIVKTYDDVPFYQNLLLQKSSGYQAIYLASNLNYSVTKKRLIMMTKNTSNKIALIKKLAIVPILVGLIYFFCIEIVAQEKVINVNSEAKNLKFSDKDKIRDAYYSGVFVKIHDEKTNRKSVTLYEDLSLEDRRKYLGFIPEMMIEKEIPESLFEKMKTKNMAVWINGKVKNKEEIKKYKRTDFSYYTSSFVYRNARSKRFPQEYQYALYTKDYFDKNLKNSHVHFSGDTIKIIKVSYKTAMKNKIVKNFKVDTLVWYTEGKEEYNLYLNDEKPNVNENTERNKKRDFAYEGTTVTIVDKGNKVNVTKKYEDLDLKLKKRYLHTHMFYLVDKKNPNEEIFEKFKNEKKCLIFINDRRIENSELEKMNRSDIFYYNEMVNPPTSTREHLYFLYTKEFYEKELSGQLKNKSKSKIKIIIT